MGKNQTHKAMQQSRHGGGGDPDAAVPDVGDGTVDVSFHSPEWHAARIAALTTERVSWEDFKKKQKEEASMAAADAENEEEAMRKYRSQLDADRAARLSHGTNNAHLKTKDGGSSKKRKRAEKDKDKKRSKDKKSSKDNKGSKDKKRSKDKKAKDSSKDKKRRRSSPSDSSGSNSDSDASEPKKTKSSGPLRLSEFLAS